MTTAKGGTPGHSTVRSPAKDRRARRAAAARTLRVAPLLVDVQIAALDYRARLLSRAEDPILPVLERVKFLVVFDRAIDEFFQVEMARLRDHGRSGAGDRRRNRVLRRASRMTHELHDRSVAAIGSVLGDLGEAGVPIRDWSTLEPAERDSCRSRFAALPLVAELIPEQGALPPVIGGGHHLLVELAERTGSRHLAVVALPELATRLVELPEPGGFAIFDQVAGANLAPLFPDMDVIGHWSFRVTRPAVERTVAAEDDPLDLVATVRREVERRRATDTAVRLEIDAGAPADARAALARGLGLGKDEVYPTAGPVAAGLLAPLLELDRPDLKLPVRPPVTPPGFAPGADVFDVLSRGDILVHHPYEAFATSVEAFLSCAADDPDVVAVKQTLYRMTGPRNPVAESLIRAAEAGKDVVALVEIRARFDEEVNIEWARQLERAGVHVVHGVLGLKTHAKIALVIRREGGTLRRYSHIGTGNYNSDTARQYEDIGLLSADPDLGADLAELFNTLSGQGRPTPFRKLLVAPDGLRPRLVELIRGQARPDGHITIKVNNLTDRDVIAELSAASRAGADVRLIVRSACCLRPGVRGLSERISVRSIIGGYLEHSRIFRFGRGAPGASFFIGSADLMLRNLDNRIEVLAPVEDPGLRERLDEILDLALADDMLAWELRADGTWRRPARVRGLDLQQVLAGPALLSPSVGPRSG